MDFLSNEVNMEEYNVYKNPLGTRYASKEMSYLFSDDKKFKTWRKLWIALAEAEKELGLNISDEQIDELKRNAENLNLDVAKKRERECRHDVMAQVYAYGKQCPKAESIIHLGATSCYVGDNADLICYYEALGLLEQKLATVIFNLKEFAKKYKDLPTLGFTHLQPAQPTTVGKRAALWLQDLVSDLENVKSLKEKFKLRGVRGTTGTAASFLELFDGDYEKVKKLNQIVLKKLGFQNTFDVTGQTYPRKFDYEILSQLSKIAQSAYKAGNDIRLLQSMKELEEPFEEKQIGSSAMAYKRNPMRSERMCSLARYVLTLPENAAITASTQWLERTLDDSANRRIVMAEGFLATDGILNLYENISDGLVVYEKMTLKHLSDELPFMATETILMEAVKAGGNRQELHEKIREHSMLAAKRVKEEGKPNDLLERIAKDSAFSKIAADIPLLADPKRFVGAAPMQTEEYIFDVVEPLLKNYPDASKTKSEISV